MSDLVLDASLALQWFLEDEADRKYSLTVLGSLSEKLPLLLPPPASSPASRFWRANTEIVIDTITTSLI